MSRHRAPSILRFWPVALAFLLVLTVAIGLVVLRSSPPSESSQDKPVTASSSASKSSPTPSFSKHRGALNILLLGSDSRDPRASSNKASPWRADTIALMHVSPRHDEALFVFFPRDLWVSIPGRGKAKINSAYSWGGQSLQRRTVEQYTGVKIDYTAVIDFGGLQTTVNALGGIDMPIERTIKSIHPPYRVFQKGTRHLNGAQALDYIRQRKQFPRGDFDRIRHQQQFLQVLLKKAASGGVLTKLDRMKTYLNHTRHAVDWYPRPRSLDLAWQFRNLRSEDITFTVSPNRGTGTIGGQSVVLSDDEKARALFGKLL